ncbi:hypothetical protein PHYPSEUDO_002823 [Phytophthora pseudosyringae]|uniref:CAAX prenyl protease 2/Lysostaphin resistance protein A-like domain-containing protein n=1 Tax=Phytophthora pseudosyringae TaxID=221518 RepID=A0A8T1VXH5_9STRA|nr:hypothetical protein PHYPSEUDO_002823 [Phytophthora pseudosyringae]
MAAAAWTWLSSKPNVEAGGQEPDPAEAPVAIRCVVLVVELALSSGAAFLLLLTSSVMGTLVRGLLHALLPAVGCTFVSEDAVGQVCEAAAFGWGLVTFMSWFFQRPKLDLVRRLTGFGWRGVKTCVASVVLHVVALMALALWQRQAEAPALVSWMNVEAAVRRPDGSVASVEILQSLLLAPMKEELFFRGVIVLVAINRLRSVTWSALISSFLFAAIHLANVGAQYSGSYVAFQVLWASLVGLFLALKLAVSGSLVECFVLHGINNLFAFAVAKTTAMDVTQPIVCVSVLVALAIYSVAIVRQFQLLPRTARSDTAGLKDR